MAVDLTRPRQTMQIIVEKTDNGKYVFSVDTILWNEVQVLLLTGAIKEGVTLEFIYQPSTKAKESNEQ